ncbi:hypothetical protein [Kineococcus sp. SYSU DK003]|uniref:hypothetical protein n=1 Tax=Kineococcus sp. SYSU DK003 TaxID=3383124 RepID=UPI003D7EB582
MTAPVLTRYPLDTTAVRRRRRRIAAVVAVRRQQSARSSHPSAADPGNRPASSGHAR